MCRTCGGSACGRRRCIRRWRRQPTDPSFKAETLTFDDVRESCGQRQGTWPSAPSRACKTIAAERERGQARRGRTSFGPAARVLQTDRRACSEAAWRDQDPHSRRLSSRPSPGREGRCHYCRFRGRSFRHPLTKGAPKTSPLRDVAVMLRSLAHAVAAAKSDLARLVPDAPLVAARLREELVLFSQIFIQAYMDTARDSPVWIEDEAHAKASSRSLFAGRIAP